MYYAPPGPGVKGRASALLLWAHGMILEPRDILDRQPGDYLAVCLRADLHAVKALFVGGLVILNESRAGRQVRDQQG